MTAFRWIMAVLAGLAAAGTAGTFAVFIGTGVDVWSERAGIARRWLYALLLFWFNVEIWRRVVLVIVHWS